MNMPENRLATDIDHGLRLEVRFLGNARAEAPARMTAFTMFSLPKAKVLDGFVQPVRQLD